MLRTQGRYSLAAVLTPPPPPLSLAAQAGLLSAQVGFDALFFGRADYQACRRGGGGGGGLLLLLPSEGCIATHKGWGSSCAGHGGWRQTTQAWRRPGVAGAANWAPPHGSFLDLFCRRPLLPTYWRRTWRSGAASARWRWCGAGRAAWPTLTYSPATSPAVGGWARWCVCLLMCRLEFSPETSPAVVGFTAALGGEC